MLAMATTTDEKTTPPPAATDADVAGRLESLAYADVDESAFFEQWLDSLFALPEVTSGAVWTLNGNGLVTILLERRPDDEDSTSRPPDPRADQARVANVIGVLQKGEPNIVEGRLIVPIRRDDRVAGGVELALDPETAEARSLELLEIVDEATGLASRYLGWRAAEAGDEAELAFWRQAQKSMLALHEAESERATARVAANDGRTLLGCERVSVVARRGSHVEVVAVTGVGRVNPRSNQVRSLARVARLVVTTGQPVVHAGRTPDLPGDVHEHLVRYLDESGVGSLLVLPLTEPSTEEDGRTKRGRTVGAIVVERKDGPFPPPVRRRVERFADHVAVAMAKARRHDRVLFRGLRSAVGGGLAALRGRRLLVAVLSLVLLAFTVTALVVVPWAYRVEGTGRLLPVVQRNVFAPATGRVEEVFVATGARVEAGQPVLRMRDDERDMEWVTLQAELEENLQSARALEAEIQEDDDGRSREESIRLRGRLQQLRVEATGLRERIDLVEAELARLVVRAPDSGTVTTADLPGLLRTRPVQQGEVLVELMDDRREWHVELEIPEQRLGHVLEAREAREAHGGEDLPVEFVLSTHPQKRFRGRLVSIATRTGASEEHGAAARAIVAVEASSVPERRIGAEVVARISCGEKPLGYVLFGDFVDFVRRHVW